MPAAFAPTPQAQRQSPAPMAFCCSSVRAPGQAGQGADRWKVRALASTARGGSFKTPSMLERVLIPPHAKGC